MERRPNEHYESYRLRRNKLQSAIKEFLKGRDYYPNNKTPRTFPAANLF